MIIRFIRSFFKKKIKKKKQFEVLIYKSEVGTVYKEIDRSTYKVNDLIRLFEKNNKPTEIINLPNNTVFNIKNIKIKEEFKNQENCLKNEINIYSDELFKRNLVKISVYDFI